MAHLSRVSGAPLDPASVMPVSAILAGYAATRPDATALVLDGARTTYGDLERQVAAAAGFLASEGIRAGDRVAWCCANTPAFFTMMLAAMRTGVVLAPLNWRQKVREIAYIFADSGARLAIADPAFMATLREAAGTQVTVVDSADFVARLATGKGDPAAPFGDWQATALLLYTSGTTGNPKGVRLSEKAISAGRVMETATGGFDDWSDEEVLLSPLPLFHIGGICWALCGLVRGCSVVLTNNPAPPALLDLCIAEGVSRTFMVPQLVRGLIEEIVGRCIRAPALKGIHYGAAPMDAALLERGIEQIGCRFLQYFGMTEMAGTITILTPDDHDPSRPQLLRSVGKVLPGSDIEVRDPQGNVLPVGQAGEIWTRGPTMMIDYLNRPEQTVEAIVDGWYRTGDGGRIDEEGFVYLTDRIKDMIVTGGENVYPVEVEAVLREHPAVADCAVYGLPDAHWGERVCAAVELRPEARFDAGDIIEFMKGQIAGYKCPREVNQVEALPRTASGKIQRGKLKQDMLEQAE